MKLQDHQLNMLTMSQDQKIRVSSENMFSLLQRVRHKNIEDICPKNNVTETYLIMDRSDLHFLEMLQKGRDFQKWEGGKLSPV